MSYYATLSYEQITIGIISPLFLETNNRIAAALVVLEELEGFQEIIARKDSIDSG